MKTKQLIFLIALLSLSAVLLSHPPSNVDLSYDAETKLLTVEVKHNVGNPGNHYIDEVIVKRGSKQILLHKISSQETAAGQTLMYRLTDIPGGTELEVSVKCNRVGKVTQKITI